MTNIATILSDQCQDESFLQFTLKFMHIICGHYTASQTRDFNVQQCVAYYFVEHLHECFVQVCSPIACISLPYFTLPSFRSLLTENAFEQVTQLCGNGQPKLFITHLPKMWLIKLDLKKSVFDYNLHSLDVT